MAFILVSSSLSIVFFAIVALVCFYVLCQPLCSPAFSFLSIVMLIYAPVPLSLYDFIFPHAWPL